MENLFSIITIFTFFRLHSKKMNFRFNTNMYFFAYTLFYIIWFIQSNISTWFPQYPLKYGVMILSLIYPITLYKDSLVRRTFWAFFSFFTYTLTEGFLMLFAIYGLKLNVQTVSTVGKYQLIFSFITNILYFFLTEIIVRLTTSQTEILDDFKIETIVLLGINLFFIITVTGLFYYNNIYLSLENALHILILCFVIMSIISFLILRKVISKSKEITNNRLLMQQMETENRLTENLDTITTNLRNLRHDMNNHFGVLQGLLSMKEYEEASSYLKDIMDDISVANNFLFSKNKKLSILLNSKICKANSMNIQIEMGEIIDHFPLSDYDLCALVGNILENAIEACKNVNEPYISFSIKKDDTHCIIQCKNTFSIPPIFINGKLQTTKSNKEIHGIGTQIIRSISERNHGYATFFADKLIYVTVAIPY